jgi:hypothetical protein
MQYGITKISGTRIAAKLVLWYAVAAAMLFGSAGTLRWLEAGSISSSRRKIRYETIHFLDDINLYL